MPLQDVTRDAVLAAIAEFDAIGGDAFLERYGFGSARSYILRHEGRNYDSKAIVGVAHGFARPDLGPLSAEDFSGGAATVGNLLGRLGFEVGQEEEQKAGRNPPWTRDELILALDYYLRHPGEAHDPNAPEIVALSSDISATARLLGLTGSDTLRNPNGVSMKLLNFRAHDPAYLARGRRGLQRGNRLETELWEEFSTDRERLASVAAGIRDRIRTADPDLVEAVSGPDEPEVAEAMEGRLVTRLHRARERNRALVKRKKASFVKQHGRVFCEACGFDFAKAYGPRGEDFIECHHTRPVAFLAPGDVTKLSDLVLLCANCHRIVHVRAPWLSVPELRDLVRRR